MIYDRHPELQSKWDKAFWARRYCFSTIGNTTEDVIKKYIKEQVEELRKEDSIDGPIIRLAIRDLLGEHVIAFMWAASNHYLKRWM